MENKKIMYVVYMEFYAEGRYIYGKYETERRANEVAIQIRDERGIDVFVLAEEIKA